MPEGIEIKPLSSVLESFKPRVSYKELDKQALNISRSVSSGNLGDSGYFSEIAQITDDPIVIVNYVKTFITTLISKLSASPYRPEKKDLYELGQKIRINALFVDIYQDVLNDGYTFVGVGIKGGQPIVKPIDARYIIFNGDDPTLKDATDIVVFEVVPKQKKDNEIIDVVTDCSFLSTYIDFDSNSERVIASHYYKDQQTGKCYLNVYDNNFETPNSIDLGDIDRLPIVRFVGEKVELQDKKYHYRGLYYQLATVINALAATGTKIHIRTMGSTDSNFIVRSDAIDDHLDSWKNSGALEVENIDSNGNPIPDVQFVPHDNDFLLRAFELWKSVISDMLGPIAASGSEAITREEVMAHNEIKDAISNVYLSKMCDSVEEVYRCINMLMTGDSSKVIILGGYIESMRRKKSMEALQHIYTLAKEGGLNTQGIIKQMLQLEDLDTDTIAFINETFTQDPFKSPQVIALQEQNKQLQDTIQRQTIQIGLLRIQATQRLERQKEFIDSTERTKRLDIALKQWTEEQKQTQEAYMAILNDCLQKGDYNGAIQILETIKSQSNPILTDEVINMASNAFAVENAKSVQSALQQTAVAPQQEIPTNGEPQDVRAAATLFNDV